MSRLARLLTQLTSTPQTQEKLAATYFDTPSPACPAPTPPSWRFVLSVVSGVGLGACLGLIVTTWQWPSADTASQAPVVYPVLSFDEAGAWDSLGQRFGLWWGGLTNPQQSIQVALDAVTRVGSSGQSLRIDYALDPSSVTTSSLGVWFQLPQLRRGAPRALELMIRGDARAGYTQHAVLELTSATASDQHVITIGPDWSVVRVPLTREQALDGRALPWREFRILFDRDHATAMRGRIYIDQIRLTTATTMPTG